MMYRFDPASGNIIVPQAALSKASPLYAKLNLPVVTGNVTPDFGREELQAAREPGLESVAYLCRTWRLRCLYRKDWVFQPGKWRRPFQITETYQNQAGQKPVVEFPNPYPSSTALATVPSQSVVEIPTQVDNGTLHQFNVTLEKQESMVSAYPTSESGTRAQLFSQHQPAATEYNIFLG